MRLPVVSRERYDEKCAELAALQAKYDAMLAELAKGVTKPKPSKPQHDAFVEGFTAKHSNEFADPALARAEAERLRREWFG